MRERFYDRSQDDLMKLLQTDAEKGLSSAEASKRLKEDGKNIINPLQKEPLRGYLWQVLSDLSAVLMLGAALLALIFRRDMGMIVMLALLFVNYAVAIAAYFSAQRVLEDLGRRARPTAKVLRQGKLTVIPAENVVMGDILYLSHGDVVPCDARLLSSENLRVLEGGLFETDRAARKDAQFQRTGTLKPVEALNMVYASTIVTAGKGTAVVCVTGEDTLVCRMGKNPPIAACHKLDIVKNLKKISSVLGVLLLIPVFALTLLQLIFGGAPIETFLTSLAFAVAAMPELYAAFAYVIVASGMRAALGERGGKTPGAYIKNPRALPKIGQIKNLILPLESFYSGEETHLAEIFDGAGFYGDKEFTQSDRCLRVLRYGIISTGIYGGTRLVEKNRESENIYTPEEEALIRAGEACRVYDRSLEDQFPILDHRAKGESGSLFDTTLVHSMGEDIVVLRGDMQTVLKNCISYSSGGKIYDMDATAYNDLMGIARTMLKNGRAPMAIATKPNAYNNLMRIVDAQSGLCFEGILAIEKPLLEGCAKQLGKLREAGLRVFCYSSVESEENLFLARALDIAQNDGQIARASEMYDMSEEVFNIHLEDYRFFAGFDMTQMKYVVDRIGEKFGSETGFFADRLEGAYPMYAAAVGFSEEDGSRPSGVRAKGSELRSPLWQKKSVPGEKYGCQALNHISDVILPPTGGGGTGGINSIAAAIRAARGIYQKTALLFLCLAFSCGMRLAALLFGVTGGVIPPVMMLVSGLIFDFAAVFVLAAQSPPLTFVRFRARKGTLRAYFAEILPVVAVGGVLFALSFGLAFLLEKGGVLLAEDRAGFFTLQLLLLQWAVLTAALRTGKPAFNELRLSRAYLLYVLLLAAFFLVCFLWEDAGALFRITFPGVKALLAACALPALILLGGVLLRVLRRGQRPTKRKTKRNKKG